METHRPSTCPREAEESDERKTAEAASWRPAAAFAPVPEGARIGSYALARQVLRRGELRQAGFNAALLERFSTGKLPVLFQRGAAHQRQRMAVARFFAPKTVDARYRAVMERFSDELIAQFRAAGRGQLDEMSFALAVAVAAEIVGLTESARPAMARRLDRFFSINPRGPGALAALPAFLRGQYHMLKFHWCDVRPAIRARRASPREDVISHLLAEGYTGREILIECLVYGAAGMATTREFIVVAAWHMFEDAALRARFLAADEARQSAILEEILRLEPVVGTLYRRVDEAFTLEAEGQSHAVPAGARLALDIRAANADMAQGACPFHLEPGRAGAAGLSFGDGPHRCPGAAVALQESAIFLDRLLRVPGLRLERAPDVRWNPGVESYELRGAIIAAG